jgi:hypothetical protein
MTVGITTLRKMTLGITTLSIITNKRLYIAAVSLTSPSIMSLIMTL